MLYTIKKSSNILIIKNNRIEFNFISILSIVLALILLPYVHIIITYIIFGFGICNIFLQYYYEIDLQNKIIVKRFDLPIINKISRIYPAITFNKLVMKNILYEHFSYFKMKAVYKVYLTGTDESIKIGTIDKNSDSINILKLFAIRFGYDVLIDDNIKENVPW